MDCANEHHGNGNGGNHHQHGNGNGGHDHEGHSHDVPLEAGPQDSLYGQIDVLHVVGLNARDGAEVGEKVIKPWSEREDESKYCESEADDTLILKIPFLSSVSIRSISIKAGPLGFTPASVQIFRDRPEMDFSDCEGATPTQIFDIVPNRQVVEYQVKAAKFTGVTSLTLFFPGNISDPNEDTTRIFYVGLRGTHQAIPPRPGVILYESAARPQDHKVTTKSDAARYQHGF
ncbi:hypothetical protein TREMEDRAFT_41222 [Tremella mesenterica DSM 1558]|uniref:uncharacterized protein n=1 Tax=Tremella mesenterica (strain ATCC 24925 / CBS 8224 / DSM 1558 / NBRC 9311 / NRRL Y-6157 / RJB 2259-6 / UBC 559-6) TaxID=578456 RepID=UPI00032D399E|nr:uncharacterized protein TREMEDRAFT_41222 [Tremella mesenterica DSM 1558]EIW65746.1 hypothetical protein TREMEDRAFT_41222 [Tremella mesenterica DSM 1558]